MSPKLIIILIIFLLLVIAGVSVFNRTQKISADIEKQSELLQINK